MTVSLSDIPDEAWIDVVAAVGWDESNELWPVLQKAVAAALPVLNTARATCDEPMPVEGNAEEAQTCDHPAIPGTDRCPVHDPRHVEYLADLVAEIQQKDTELEEWRTGALRLLVDRDTETDTAEPELVMGTRPDGSPWVVSAEFDGPTVRVDGHGALRLYGKAISPRTAHKLATGLLAAIAWLENDGAAKAEAAASLRGEQGE